MMQTPGQVSVEVLEEIVRRIVSTAKPTRIILFGSAARGMLGPHSDLDFLVVVPDGTHRRETSMRIYRALLGLGTAADVVVVTESDVCQYGDNSSLVICPALREGKELYVAGQ